MNNILDQEQDGYSNAITKEFFKSVYSYMFAALSISGVIAYYCGTREFFETYFLSSNGGLSMLYYVVAFSPLVLVILISTSYRRFSLGTLIFMFMLYSALFGASISTIFLRYTGSEIASTFFISSGSFGLMAFLGYTTKTDLSKFGSLLYMALFGLLIAVVVNLFFHSQSFNYLISILGVFIFTGLTAYDMQNLKKISSDSSLDADSRNKIALIGSLDLYLNFVNLFLFLLRLLGNRD